MTAQAQPQKPRAASLGAPPAAPKPAGPRLGAPPAPAEAKGNTLKEPLVQLNGRVPKDLHLEIRKAALDEGIDLGEYFGMCHRFYQENKGKGA